MSGLRIVEFRPEYAGDFRRLNLEWIEELFAVEAPDLKVLDDPERAIVAPGGAIFVALDGDTVVGTAAMIRVTAERYELAKMAVTTSHRRRGVGELLARACLDWATSRGARSVFLETNSRLDNAIRLYERLGFRCVPRRRMSDYARGDYYMEMTLEPGRS